MIILLMETNETRSVNSFRLLACLLIIRLQSLFSNVACGDPVLKTGAGLSQRRGLRYGKGTLEGGGRGRKGGGRRSGRRGREEEAYRGRARVR